MAIPQPTNCSQAASFDLTYSATPTKYVYSNPAGSSCYTGSMLVETHTRP